MVSKELRKRQKRRLRYSKNKLESTKNSENVKQLTDSLSDSDLPPKDFCPRKRKLKSETIPAKKQKQQDLSFIEVTVKDVSLNPPETHNFVTFSPTLNSSQAKEKNLESKSFSTKKQMLQELSLNATSNVNLDPPETNSHLPTTSLLNSSQAQKNKRKTFSKVCTTCTNKRIPASSENSKRNIKKIQKQISNNAPQSHSNNNSNQRNVSSCHLSTKSSKKKSSTKNQNRRKRLSISDKTKINLLKKSLLTFI